MDVLHGGCLCGTVRFEIRAPLGPTILCHCNSCRRASGAAFAANASLRADGLAIVAGEGAIAAYESSPGKTRTFCTACGSPLYTEHAALPGVRRIRLGTLDTDPGVRPTAHIWLREKAPWYELGDDGLARFDEFPTPDYLAPG